MEQQSEFEEPTYSTKNKEEKEHQKSPEDRFRRRIGIHESSIIPTYKGRREKGKM